VSALRERLSDHLRSPLTRNGYALLLSSASTSVLGLGYWILAARLYSEGTLGRGAALVAAMLLVTSLATAGLKRALIRFVPTSGSSAAMVVGRIYAVGLGVSLAAGALFFTAFQGWVPGLPALDHGLLAPIAFLIGIAAWGIFVLQDAVLIGADRSTLVPVTNTIFSVLKIALLAVGLWVFSAGWGIFASWVIPAVLVGVPVNLWLFRKGLRRLARPDEPKPPTTGELARFTSGEYVASLAWQAANYFTPLLVIARAGATANAHYYVPAQIAYTFFLISSNVTDALVAEGAVAHDGLARKVRRSSSQTALILVPGVALAVLAAPLIMSMFGPGYTGEAATVLRLLSLAALPNALTTVVIAVAHVRQRMSTVVLLQAVMSALTLGLSWVLVGSHGVVGVAWAWLVAQLVTAVLAVAVAVATEAPMRRSAVTRLVALASNLRARVARGPARKTLATQLAALPEGTLPSGPVQLLAYQHDLLVARAGTGADEVVVRLAAGRQGRRGIAAHRSQLRSLHADRQLGAIGSLIPRVVRADVGAGWLVETAAEGIPAASLQGETRDRAVSAGLTTLDCPALGPRPGGHRRRGGHRRVRRSRARSAARPSDCRAHGRDGHHRPPPRRPFARQPPGGRGWLGRHRDGRLGVVDARAS
jgi:O-antigen/teichoic acid export membrane protein